MVLNSVIILNTKFKDPTLIKKLISQLTYNNPKYFEASRLGFSTYNIPKTIQTFTFEEETSSLKIQRGEISKILSIFPEEKINVCLNVFSRQYEEHFIYQNNDFELDSRQRAAVSAIVRKKQGIIHAATSAGKSAIIIAAIAEISEPTLIIVNRKICFEQLYDDAKKWLRDGNAKRFDGGSDEDPVKTPLLGRIIAGKKTLGKITFALDKSASKLLERDPRIFDGFNVLIQDECHVSPCTTFQNVINRIPAERRYGLTGTLKRKDGMEFMIHSTFGKVIAKITAKELLEADRVTPVEVKVTPFSGEVDPAFFDLNPTQKHQAIDKALHENPERLRVAMTRALDIVNDNPQARIVILSRYVDPCYAIGAEITSGSDIPVEYVTGREKDASAACKRLQDGTSRIMCATIGCFSTGVNIPALTDVVLISPMFTNELLIHQIRGRLMRKYPGKEKGFLHFIWDEYVFPSYKLDRFKAIMSK